MDGLAGPRSAGTLRAAEETVPAASGMRQQKCTAWPVCRKRRSKGGTAITSAWSSSTAACSLARFSASDTTMMSVSRLNSAPPYNTHAWPPISSERTPFRRIVERTLRIGLGVKRTSQFEVRLPQFRRLLQPLGRGKRVPLRPFVSNEGSKVDHMRSPTTSLTAIGRRGEIALAIQSGQVCRSPGSMPRAAGVSSNSCGKPPARSPPA